MDKNKRKRTFISLFVLFLASVIFSGCFQSSSPQNEPYEINQNPTETITEDSRKLHISADILQSDKLTLFTAQDLNNAVNQPLMYFGLQNVRIDINGISYKFEDALKNQDISPEEIFLYARMDAKSGICIEESISTNGLTKFIYQYPEYDIKIVYDILETPDGKQHLINDLALYKKGLNKERFYVDESGTLLDREDWGVSFTVTEVTPTSLTIQCTQSDGEHIGEITTECYYLVADSNTSVPAMQKEKEYHILPQTVLKNSETTIIKIDWTDIYGNLPIGNYKLWLQLRDNFDKSGLHPLMQDFYEAQVYWIEFTIE